MAGLVRIVTLSSGLFSLIPVGQAFILRCRARIKVANVLEEFYHRSIEAAFICSQRIFVFFILTVNISDLDLGVDIIVFVDEVFRTRMVSSFDCPDSSSKGNLAAYGFG